MRKLITGAAAVAAAISLTGCGGWEGVGEVIDKDFDSGYTTMIATSTGKSTVMVPTYIPPNYDLLLQDAGGEEHWVSVDPVTFQNVEIGETYSTIQEDEK